MMEVLYMWLHQAVAEFLQVEELIDEKDGAKKYQSFVNSYNYEREHGAINGMTPAEKFMKCLKPRILEVQQLIQWHKDYWFRVKGKQEGDAQVPNLDVYIVDVWPTVEHNIPQDHDGVQGRQLDLILNDKTDYDQKVADIVSDYIRLFQKTKDLALKSIKGQNEKKAFQTELDKLKEEKTKSKHRSGQPRQYKDLINGDFMSRLHE
jgi:hypothetical protein